MPHVLPGDFGLTERAIEEIRARDERQAHLFVRSRWLAYRTHPLAGALERYEAATAGIRVCDVCRLACGDSTPKEGVVYCGRYGAWICPKCRRRPDLRAITALKRGRAGAAPGQATGD